MKNTDPYRNLLVAAINKLIESGHINLEYDKENPETTNEPKYIETELFGEKSKISWNHISYGEMHFSVWWKYEQSKHPRRRIVDVHGQTVGYTNEWPDLSKPINENRPNLFVGVCTHCWFERLNGKYIDSPYIMREYTRKGELENLKNLPIQTPIGYLANRPKRKLTLK